jgi:dTMP kinase
VNGTLVAIEGIDGAGKTTQARRLVEALHARGISARYTKEPTDGPHGRALRASAVTGRLPPEEELALFVADRREHVATELRPALAEGEVVVVDRYYLSTAAYQGARGLDPVAILAANEAFAPIPGLCLLLDLDPAAGVARVRGRDRVENLFEQVEDLRRCREVFLEIDRPWIVRLDAARAEEDLAAEVLSLVLQRVLADP